MELGLGVRVTGGEGGGVDEGRGGDRGGEERGGAREGEYGGGGEGGPGGDVADVPPEVLDLGVTEGEGDGADEAGCWV